MFFNINIHNRCSKMNSVNYACELVSCSYTNFDRPYFHECKQTLLKPIITITIIIIIIIIRIIVNAQELIITGNT